MGSRGKWDRTWCATRLPIDPTPSYRIGNSILANRLRAVSCFKIASTHHMYAHILSSLQEEKKCGVPFISSRTQSSVKVLRVLTITAGYTA